MEAGSDVSSPNDNPIKVAGQDALGRDPLAKRFSNNLLELDASEGLVVGVLGPWGSGKTSFLNLTRAHLEASGATLLDFNPWMFSGAEQLVESFFGELASQLKVRPGLATIGDDLESYGEAFSGMAWLPVVGPWIERGRLATKLASRLLRRKRPAIGDRREKLTTALAGLEDPIIVVLDDIDRLTTAEIRDMFKLVRLTASFPNVIYLVAFDRKRVEDALGEQGIPGRDYLEKILQVGVDLPSLPKTVVNREVFLALDQAIEGIAPVAPFTESVWPDIYAEVISPLIRNMRDIRRYAAAVRGTIAELEGRIELSDVLALEAIRVFLPDLFAAMSDATEALTDTSDIGMGRGRDDGPLKTQIEHLVEAAAPRTEVASALVNRVFPAASRHIGGSNYGSDWQRIWLRERRVSHKDLLRFYFERVVGEHLQSFVDGETAWRLMDDQHSLDEFLQSLEPEHLEDVIGSLEVYEDEFAAEQVVPTVTVLLNLLPGMPVLDRGMFYFGSRMVVGRVVYRLLRSLAAEAAVFDAAKAIYANLASLSSKFELVSVIGFREGQGHKLVSETAAAGLEMQWRADVRASQVNDLLDEVELLTTLYWAQQDARSDEPPLAVPDDRRLTLAILVSARSYQRSQALGNRTVRKSARLWWDGLVAVFGGEDALRTRLSELRAGAEQLDFDGLDELLELADRYENGWRPERDAEE